jgi:hypothetical protein
MLFEDGTVSISYNNSPTPGFAIKAITIEGLQNEIKIIDQVLDSLSPAPGVVDSTDTIVTMANKLVSASDVSYGTPLITSTSAILTPFQRLCQVTDIDQTITLPSSSDPAIIPGTICIIIFPEHSNSPGTIVVGSGDFLNGALDGIYLVPAISGIPNAVRVTSIGNGWYVC